MLNVCRIIKKLKRAILAAMIIMVILDRFSVATPKNGNSELFHAMVEAGVQAGYPRTDDLNGYQQEGFGPMDRTVTPQGRRSSTARGYLDMAKGRDNLTIISHAMTNRILFNRNQAIGVRIF